METEIWNLYNQISDSFVLDDDDEPIEEKKEIKKNTCYNCGISDCLQTNNENVVCTKCGVVNDDIIDYQAEWRYYGTDDNKKTSDPNRCGIPNSHISESSLGTVILGKGFEGERYDKSPKKSN
jgi:transcription initiation factor TFIIIB Brf1 subunit/transcription initiation factor TFIIB